MPQKIVDFYNTRPAYLEDGDVFVAVVTCHVSHIDRETDTIYVRLYRGKYPPYSPTGIPQGDRVGGSHKEEIETARALFPVLNSFEHVEIL